MSGNSTACHHSSITSSTRVAVQQSRALEGIRNREHHIYVVYTWRAAPGGVSARALPHPRAVRNAARTTHICVVRYPLSLCLGVLGHALALLLH